MSNRWMKKCSGKLTGSGLLKEGRVHYFGFVLKTSDADKLFRAWDSKDSFGCEDEKLVEDMMCDGNKPSDGHSHADPILCLNGIYYDIASGGSAVIYYWDDF